MRNNNNNAIVQYGSGLADIGTIYRGPQFVQRGRGGIGSIFSGLWRHLAPLATSGLKTLGKQSLRTGGNVLRDWASGKDLKNSLLEQGQDAINNLAEKGVNKLKKMQSGRGFLAIKERDPRRNRIVGHLGRYGDKRSVSMRRRGRRRVIGKLNSSTQTGGRRKRRRTTRRKAGCKQTGAGRRRRRGGRKRATTTTQAGGRRRRRKRGSRKTTNSRGGRKNERSIDIFDF